VSESIFSRARDRVRRAAEQTTEPAPAAAAPEPAPVAVVEPAPVKKPKKPKRADVIAIPAAPRVPLRLPRLTSVGALAKLGAAGFIWWWGLGNTSAFLSELLAPAVVGFSWAVGAQVLLTALEADFFGGRRGSRVAQLALAADTLTNVVGVWVYIPNIPRMRIYQIISEHVVTLPAQLDEGGPRFLVAVVAGVLIAWAPEALFKSASH
jgi:hypothetical protein